jgi:hypothetical protein
VKLFRRLILAAGAWMVTLFALWLVWIAMIMERFVGIPWSTGLGLLQANPGWAALLLVGLSFLGLALCLFLRAHLQSNSDWAD